MVVKRNSKYLLYRILVSHLFIIVLALSGELRYKDIFVVWLVTVIIPNVLLSLVKNLSSIEFKDDNIQLVFNKWFFKKHIESYKYDDLLFTYKTECESKAWDTVFRIYKKGNEKSIISVEGIINGWYENDIRKIIIELEKRGISVVTDIK